MGTLTVHKSVKLFKLTTYIDGVSPVVKFVTNIVTSTTLDEGVTAVQSRKSD